jgi:hypothetical protein
MGGDAPQAGHDLLDVKGALADEGRGEESLDEVLGGAAGARVAAFDDDVADAGEPVIGLDQQDDRAGELAGARSHRWAAGDTLAASVGEGERDADEAGLDGGNCGHACAPKAASASPSRR